MAALNLLVSSAKNTAIGNCQPLFDSVRVRSTLKCACVCLCSMGRVNEMLLFAPVF